MSDLDDIKQIYESSLDQSQGAPLDSDENSDKFIVPRVYQNNQTAVVSCNQTDAKILIYTRIGKAGSSSLIVWMNNFSYKNYLLKRGANDPEEVTLEKEKEIVRSIMETPVPMHYQGKMLFEQHVHYLNFTRHSFPQPAMFSMMRAAGKRYLSQFHFWRSLNTPFGQDLRNRNQTVIDCLLTFPNVTYGCPTFNYQTSYLCGNGPPCTNPPDEATFAEAKRHLEHDYAVVTILEEFALSKLLLHAYFPHFFELDFLGNNEHSKRNEYHSTEEEEILSEKYNSFDAQLYNLAKEMFFKKLNSCGISQ